jgi:hypothetical protein
MYNLEVGDLVIYLPEFHGVGDRSKFRLYELISLSEGLATIRACTDPNNVKNVSINDLELSFSLNNPDEGFSW